MMSMPIVEIENCMPLANSGLLNQKERTLFFELGTVMMLLGENFD